MAAPAQVGCGVRAAFLLLLAGVSLHAANYYVIITGLGGEAEYETQFAKWGSDLERELKANGSDTHIEKLSGDAATREHIQQVFSQVASQIQPDDAFGLFLIGHGTFDGTEYKFNIPGPDITAVELAALLNRVPATRQLVVNMTSCSGASIPALAKKNRIVITATKSGTEKNAPVFPRYWIDALQDPATDSDKNGTVSVLEAFNYAQRKTAAYFDSEKLLATEHPLFTDTGTKNAVRDPKPENGQGLLAAAYPVLRPPAENAQVAANPEKQKLVSRKEAIEAKIDRLKYQKSSMPEEEYKQQLTGLLLELARTQAEIDR
jgi:hypothetical protein